MTRVFLLRHSESEWNAEGRWQGQADPALSERGRSEARAAAPRLIGAVSRIVASDLRRAVETADIIAKALGVSSVERDPALREIDVGQWSGLTTAEIDERWPGGIEQWRNGEDPGNGGEDRSSFRLRVVEAVRTHAGRDDSPLLVVTHGAAIGMIERHLGVHPGVPVPKLVGRWFDFDGELHVGSDRVALIEVEERA